MDFEKVFTPTLSGITSFVFWYPLIMSLFWIAGTIIYIWFRDRDQKIDFSKVNWPLITFLVPCYNEEDTIEETLRNLRSLSYPLKEIILINDGSTDGTAAILHKLSKSYSDVRIIQLFQNRGKANALHLGAHAAKAEFLLCLDSDAILDDDAPYYLIYHFLHKGERLGAVTGNPRIRNRNTLLSRMQLIEYSSIIGAIKRTQRIIGKVMTVSGVVVAFRKKALVDVGLWDRDMITEDIAVSWKLQQRFWDIRYEPRALCWMFVPETLRGIWKQRVRWAQGGQEVMLRHWRVLFQWNQRRIWLVYIEQWISTIWSFAWLFVTLLLILAADEPQEMLIWFTFTSFTLVMMSLIQLFIALKIDSKFDHVKRYYLWAAWYPVIYWIVNTLVVIRAFPKAVRSRLKGGYATWSSPDRGLTKNSK
ncbi:poly-beta-1,6-N-acetyl-D-glucosamine synthase [Niallia sp. 03133]|uniref:poly-beta-1,6-N-acetyl-D-glucosamine synthase n=1 Tax=Niallia sp. 03133 TaxID=3458060 RepID=UPI004044DFF1